MQVILQFLPNFMLVFCRITAFFVIVPIFSSRGVPVQFKVGIAFFVSILIFLSLGEQEAIEIDGDYVLSIIKETLMGLLIGFVAYLFFTVVQIAGSFIDMQLGFGIANVIDPMTGAQSPIFGNFKFILAMLLFLSINGHHYLLLAIMKSYEWAPLHHDLFLHIQSGNLTDFLIRTFSSVFYLAFQMSAPLVVSLFLVDVSLGILARTVPQLNIFVVGIPIKIIIGLLFLSIIIPSLLFLFQDLFKAMFEAIHQILLMIQK